MVISGSSPVHHVLNAYKSGRQPEVAAKAPEEPFSARLDAAVRGVSDKQVQADDHLAALASGEEADLHGTMIALQEADISLRAMVAVRDKVVDAYQQVMNMSV